MVSSALNQAFLLVFVLAAPLRAQEPVLGPYVAGQFYPAEASSLEKIVSQMMKEAPERSIEGKLLGALVPHAGYVYSGPVAARLFKMLKGRSYKTVILLGSAHRVQLKGAAVLTSGSWKTPLGSVAVNSELAGKLIRLTSAIEHNPQAFENEHSIEVELPFLQKTLGSFSLVPLILNTDDPKICEEIGLAVAQIAATGKVLILISSDLSHYPDKNTASRVDRSSLEALRRSIKDPGYFWTANRLLMKRGGPDLVCTYCGEAAVLAGLYAFRQLGANEVAIMDYTNSGLLPHGDPSRSVGYASVAWSRKKIKKTSGPSLLDEKTQKKLLSLARSSIEEYLKDKSRPPSGLWEEPELNLPANVFVTLEKKTAGGWQLRGCMGNVQPHWPLGEAVLNSAILSATEDRRFQPVSPQELPFLRIEISRLSAYRPVKASEIVPHRDGVLLSAPGEKSGLFLPQVWESIPEKERFLNELCSQKAGLPPDCWKNPDVKLLAFTVEVFAEQNR